MDWFEVIGWAIGILGLTVGVVFAVKWNQAVALLKELGEAFQETAYALEDKKLTKQEAIDCLREWVEVFKAIKFLLNK